MDTKTKVTYGVIVIAVAVLGWFSYGMIFGESGEAASEHMTKPNPDIPKPAALNQMQSAQPVKQQASAASMTEREMQLMQMQQETQARYLAALNELQMLKVQKDIAETSKDISKAKLDMITAQKNTVDLLAPVKFAAGPDAYVKGLDQTAIQHAADMAKDSKASAITAQVTAEYTVISVSRLRGEWTAVIGAGGTLYNVRSGDVLAMDGSIVIAINRNGVIIEKDGKRTKLSMASII